MSFEARIVRQTLLEWCNSRYPIDRVLNETLREHRVGAGQRPAITDAVYALVRFWPVHFQKGLRSENPESLRALDEVVRASLEESHAGEGLRRHEKAKPRFEGDALAHLRELHGAAAFLTDEMQAAPAEWHDCLHALMGQAPLTVRINPLKISSAEFAQRYAAQGAKASEWIEGSFSFPERWGLVADPGFQEGLFEIQDEHSQLVSLLAAPESGMKVLDLCAGGGGKSLHMASLMQGKGEVQAYDVNARKVAALVPRARRAGLGNIRVLRELKGAGPYDLVLIDAPCSGLGTLRRSPDRIYSFDADEARALRATQSELVRRGLDLLKAGGRLVYATCTMRPAENAKLLESILGPAHTGRSVAAALKSALAPRADAFLTSAAATPFARLGLKSAGGAPKDWQLQLGPSGEGPSQASGRLSGDAFFIALVN